MMKEILFARVAFALAAMLCLVLPGAAQARPRDEVMAGAFRCAAVGDSRAWLDCYYGAAQPVRAELGLAPAPAAQLHLAQSPPPGTPADSAVRDAVLGGAFRCAGAADERQWLDCYYGAAQPMRAQLGLSPAPQARVAALPAPTPGVAVIPVPAARPPMPRKSSGGWFSGIFGSDGGEAVPEQEFGKIQPETASMGGNVDHVVSRLAKYSFDHYGVFTVTLANGQVWRQLSGDTDYAHWTKPAGSYTASITRGWFGSYNFQVKDNPGMFKVKREH